MTTILEEIAAFKREKEVPALLVQSPIEEYKRLAKSPADPLDFIEHLTQAEGIALLAEIKKASPSRGLLRADFDPAQLARGYAAGGANAISVLTDAPYFQGNLDHFRQVRAACPLIPLLRKDFIIHPVQVYQARAAGADAILLITAILDNKEIFRLMNIAHSLGMAALVEIHNQDELDRVLPLYPGLIGINNRNLHDFSVDIKTCLRLRSKIPAGITVIAESGIHTKQDIAQLQKAGIHAALIGEAIVKSVDVEKKIKDLLSSVRCQSRAQSSAISAASLQEVVAS